MNDMKIKFQQVPPRKFSRLNEKKRTVEKFYTRTVESSEHVRFFTAKKDC
jgi:hypothetical protein